MAISWIGNSWETDFIWFGKAGAHPQFAELSQLDRSLPAASRTYCAVSAVLQVFLIDVRGFLGFFACTGGAETDFSTVV